MDPLDEMLEYVGFGPSDLARLRSLWPAVQPHLQRIVDRFYDRLLAHEGAAAVLEDEAQVLRLKATLGVWLEELLTSERDADYGERRRRIGTRHVEVGLDSRYMFTAMSVITDDLHEIGFTAFPDVRQGVEVCQSVQRACAIDLALMTGTYVESRERRQLATLQELLVSHLRVTVLLVAPEGHVVASTQRSARLFGERDVRGIPWVDAVTDDLRQAAGLEERVERALQTRRPLTMPRIDVGAGTSARSYAIHVVPLDHPLAAFLLQIEDLTEAVALEGRLRRTEALAQLGSLSAAVAHELRNPLAGISGAIQVIHAGLDDEDPHRPIMARVEAEIRRLDALVTDLLAFARQGAVTTREVALRPPVDAALALVRSDHPDITWTVHGEGRARGDENLVQQIVLNLLQNAAHATGPGGRVEVQVEGTRIAVSDDGPGIPAEELEQVFQPFYTTKTRGTGLGLAICRRSATAMRGTLTASTGGSLPGARLLLELPPP